uniref:Paraneoplastic antigen Ma-like C-terminal domain-containing protein n=1 Tax=Acanthochromis polyacanthus TaxID=80966 RepID=A0A3Q1F8T1_9TELE
MALVPEDVEIAVIEETILTIKCLGRVRVRGHLFHTSLNCLLVLCKCKEDVPEENALKEVFNQDSGESWQIVTLKAAIAPDDFPLKLKTLLDAEGKTMEDIQGLLSSSTRPPPIPHPSSNSTESILQAVGDLLEKTRKPQAEGGYRHLRLFSGNLPVPPSEEPLDHWLEQAWLMVEESDCTDKEKRCRLMESLKGPALEIAKSVRDADPEASPTEYLEALESAFGSAESGDDLYFTFRLMQQQPSEKLSNFLRCLERALTKVIQRGGVPASSKDQARLEQLLRGAVASDLMLIQLRLRGRKSSPPTFLQLLSEIRTEEEYEASRRKLNTSVHQAQTKPSGADHAEIQSLKAEVKELKTKLASCMLKSPEVKEKSLSPVSTMQPRKTPTQFTVVTEPELSQDSDSSSEYECYEPQQHYYTREKVKEELRKALRSRKSPQETLVNDQENDSDEHDSNNESDSEESQMEEEESVQDSETETNPVVITPEGSDHDEEDNEDSAPEQELNPRASWSATTPKLRRTPCNKLADTPKLGSKRQVKPVVRLTYDEPGKAKDQSITIIHRGIVITIGKD